MFPRTARCSQSRCAMKGWHRLESVYTLRQLSSSPTSTIIMQRLSIMRMYLNVMLRNTCMDVVRPVAFAPVNDKQQRSGSCSDDLTQICVASWQPRANKAKRHPAEPDRHSESVLSIAHQSHHPPSRETHSGWRRRTLQGGGKQTIRPTLLTVHRASLKEDKRVTYITTILSSSRAPLIHASMRMTN